MKPTAYLTMTRAERAEQDEQTAQDYSIVIKRSATSDLPRDATDPHEWHDYFLAAFGAHVTVCTIAVDNDDWVRKLVRRREALRRLELALAPGTSLDSATLDELAAQAIAARSWFTPRWVCRHVLPPDVAELVARVRDASREMDGGPLAGREASRKKRADALDALGFPALAALDRGEDPSLEALEDPNAPPAPRASG